MKEKLREALKVLSLSNSDTRNATIESLIIGLLQKTENIEKSGIQKGIKEQYDVLINQFELESSLKALEDKSSIVIEANAIKFHDDFKAILAERKINDRSKREARKGNFEKNIKTLTDQNLFPEEINLLFDGYEKYISEVFYLNGKSAYEYFHPELEFKGSSKQVSEDLKTFIDSLFEDKEHRILLSKYIDKQQDFLLKDDIDYLFDLSQKSNSFLSLGLPPDLQKEIYYEKLINWVIFLDTNYIYSILDLHDHPENDAAKELLKLIHENDLPIKFRYLNCTAKELQYKRSEWERNIPFQDWKKGHLRAALKSNKIDGVTKTYFNNLLENSESTIHPSKVVEQSAKVLRNSKIEPYKEEFKTLDEAFIKARIADYSSYIFTKNQARLDKGFQPIYRHDKQIEHDVFLREAILYLRFRSGRTVESMNDAKYFGLTLDNTLIAFDKIEFCKKPSSLKYVSFFKPSFLLSRIIRLIPADTTNYKRAFITAITSKSFHGSSKDSSEVLKTLNYLCKMGINEEEAVYELISESSFIEKLQDKTEEESKNIIESELSKLLEERQNKIQELSGDVSEIKAALANKASENDRKKKELEVSEKELSRNRSIEGALIKEVKKLQKQVKKLSKETATPKIQQEFNFDSKNTSTVNEDKQEYQKNEPWYKKIWAKITGVIFLLAAIAEMLGIGVLDLREKLNKQDLLEKQEIQDSLNIKDDEIKKTIKSDSLDGKQEIKEK